ncbi:MAG: zinc-binding dehydrogenase [Chloroflexota bacterium]|nr:zinc-binding dehydrogenase [Chloroflexota bacterium]
MSAPVIATRVARLVAPGRIEVVDECFELRPRDVAVKIAACGLCSWEAGFYTGQRETVFPRPIGHEPSGIVEAVGSDVTEWRAGDRVAGMVDPLIGAFATYARTVPEKLVRVPDHVPLELAIVEPVKCIVTGLRAANPEFGDHSLVVGCGFMGLLCVAGLRSPGLGSLIAVDLVDERLELARNAGATHCLNPARDDVPACIAAITGGHGIDVAMEASAVPAGFDLASQALRRGRARLVVVTTALPGATYDAEGCMRVGASVHFAEPGYCLDPPDELRRAMDALARGVLPMDKLITHRFGLSEIGNGIQAGVSRTPGYIKGIVVP